MTTAELLQAILVPTVDHEIDPESGHVVLLQPRFRRAWVQRFFSSPGRRHVRIHLDAIGSWVWSRLDDATPMEAIAQELTGAFPEEEDPQMRIVLFARQLLGSHLAKLA